MLIFACESTTGVYNYRRKKRHNEIQRREKDNEELVTQSTTTLRNYIFIERPWARPVNMFDERLRNIWQKSWLCVLDNLSGKEICAFVFAYLRQ